MMALKENKAGFYLKFWSKTQEIRKCGHFRVFNGSHCSRVTVRLNVSFKLIVELQNQLKQVSLDFQLMMFGLPELKTKKSRA
jgi:hypothetical protein